MHHYNVYSESSSIWIFIPYCIYHWTYTTFNIIMYSRVHLLSHSSSLYVYYIIHTLYIDYCTLQHHIIIGYTFTASKHCIIHLIVHALLVHATVFHFTYNVYHIHSLLVLYHAWVIMHTLHVKLLPGIRGNLRSKMGLLRKIIK